MSTLCDSSWKEYKWNKTQKPVNWIGIISKGKLYNPNSQIFAYLLHGSLTVKDNDIVTWPGYGSFVMNGRLWKKHKETTSWKTSPITDKEVEKRFERIQKRRTAKSCTETKISFPKERTALAYLEVEDDGLDFGSLLLHAEITVTSNASEFIATIFYGDTIVLQHKGESSFTGRYEYFSDSTVNIPIQP